MTRHDASGTRGLFVTGTDTGVGKTLVACEVVRRLRTRGLRVGVLKPVETGVGPEGPLDAIALREAAGLEVAIDEVCPQHFALPAAPSVAAAAEGRSVDLRSIDVAMQRVMADHECVIVEGAGGLLVPLAEGFSMADLALRHRLSLLVVCRASLGTLNHTRLTLEAAASRRLPVVGIVISHGAGALGRADAANLEDLRRDPGVPLVGEIPPLVPGQRIAEQALDLGPILEALA
jgi:dethiobiotin synthetase